MADIPKILPCEHTFCGDCLKGFVQDERRLVCPLCRSDHELSDLGLQGLPDSLVANEDLDIEEKLAECSDCKETLLLEACEHCGQQVCDICRAGHNRLQGEIIDLLQVLDEKVLTELQEDENFVSQATVDGIRSEEAKVEDVFDKVMKLLTERRKKLRQRLRILANVQRVIEGRESLVNQYADELHSYETSGHLHQLKELLSALDVEHVLWALETGVKFEYNPIVVAKFGQIMCDGIEWSGRGRVKQSAARSEARSAGSYRDKARGSVASESGDVRLAIPRGLASRTPSFDSSSYETSTANLYPHGVKYTVKNYSWKLFIDRHPKGKEFSPNQALFWVQSGTFCCISDGELFFHCLNSHVQKFGNLAISASDIAFSSSGKLFATDGKCIKRVSMESLRSWNSSQQDFPQSQALTINRDVRQICCYGEEIVVLDTKGKCISFYTEDAKLLREWGAERLTMIDGYSKMCVGKEGLIYVSGIHVERIEREDLHCDKCLQPRSVSISVKLSISVFLWDGTWLEEFLVDDSIQSYDYSFSGFGCGKRRQDSVPSDKEIRRDHSIRGVCVDGDGYVSVTLGLKNQILVFDPARKLHCTIGDPKKRPAEFRDPSGLALMPDGRMIVCDTGNKRVQII